MNVRPCARGGGGRRGCGAALGLALAAFGWAPAFAEDLVLTLSTREVAITSTYTGAELTVFGLIERDGRTIARSGVYDIVANVLGPRGDVVVQQKQPLGPIWLTAARRRFSKIPLFFSVLSARPLAEIISEDTKRRLKLELDDHLPPLNAVTPAQEEEERAFRQALLRLQAQNQAATREEKAIVMVRPNLFSGRVVLPATAPTGLYVINVTILSEGVPLKTAQAGFVVRKVGFDAFVANAARGESWLYAAITIAMAVFLGWLANVVFRKD